MGTAPDAAGRRVFTQALLEDALGSASWVFTTSPAKSISI